MDFMGSTKHEKSFVDFEQPYEQNVIGLKGIFYFGIGLVDVGVAECSKRGFEGGERNVGADGDVGDRAVASRAATAGRSGVRSRVAGRPRQHGVEGAAVGIS